MDEKELSTIAEDVLSLQARAESTSRLAELNDCAVTTLANRLTALTVAFNDDRTSRLEVMDKTVVALDRLTNHAVDSTVSVETISTTLDCISALNTKIEAITKRISALEVDLGGVRIRMGGK